jgi:hypothetical protein
MAQQYHEIWMMTNNGMAVDDSGVAVPSQVYQANPLGEWAAAHHLENEATCLKYET